MGGHANAIAGAQKAGRQNRGDAHLASGLARIDSQALVLDDFRRWPHDQASHPLAGALLHLVQAEQVARQAVALVPGRDVEVQLGIDAVRVRAPHVERHARCPQVRAGHAHPQRRFAVDAAQIAHAADEDLVLVEEPDVGVVLLGRARHPVAEAAHELVIEIAVHATDAVVVEQHPGSREGTQHLHDLVALDEAPQDGRQAAQVEGHPAHEQGMAGDTQQLPRQHADVLGPARHGDVHELLEGHHRRPLAEQGADVFQRVEVADGLVVIRVLAQLLDTPVQIAEDRIEIRHDLAVDLHDDPQHAVRRRMLGAHIEEHLAVAEGVELGLALRARREGRHGLEDADLLLEDDARIVGRRAAARDGRACGHSLRRPLPGGRRQPASNCADCASAPCAALPPPASARRRRPGRNPCAAGSWCSRVACRCGAGRGCPRT